MNWQENLIALFIYVSVKNQSTLFYLSQRMSNNSTPDFTDEEVITIYLNGIMNGYSEIKKIHRYTCTHLIDWFPKLPSYPAFVQRLNRLDDAFPVLVEKILDDFPFNNTLRKIRLIDSMPIILANAKRSSKAKVAQQLADKGYCSSKDMYYYGVKLHIVASKQPGTLPLPDYISINPASEHDLVPFRQIAPFFKDMHIYGDKAYNEKSLQETLINEQRVELHTPPKNKKGQKYLGLFDQVRATSVSRIRQPIESLFNWIEEKTKIQIASKVRSYNGLMIHVFGKLAAAMFLLVFNP